MPSSVYWEPPNTDKHTTLRPCACFGLLFHESNFQFVKYLSSPLPRGIFENFQLSSTSEESDERVACSLTRIHCEFNTPKVRLQKCFNLQQLRYPELAYTTQVDYLLLGHHHVHAFAIQDGDLLAFAVLQDVRNILNVLERLHEHRICLCFYIGNTLQHFSTGVSYSENYRLNDSSPGLAPHLCNRCSCSPISQLAVGPLCLSSGFEPAV